jgi:hypothetical protein
METGVDKIAAATTIKGDGFLWLVFCKQAGEDPKITVGTQITGGFVKEQDADADIASANAAHVTLGDGIRYFKQKVMLVNG